MAGKETLAVVSRKSSKKTFYVHSLHGVSDITVDLSTPKVSIKAKWPIPASTVLISVNSYE